MSLNRAATGTDAASSSLLTPPELQEAFESLSRGAEQRTAQQLVVDAIGVLGADRLCILSSFGAESAVLLHLVSTIDKTVTVLFLDTGKHFGETIRYKRNLLDRIGMTNVVDTTPDPIDLGREDGSGDLWLRDPARCCHLRKVKPMEQGLERYAGWFTGRKRFQNDVRARLEKVELVGKRIRLNPLADWTPEHIRDWFVEHELPAHPLEADGYLSIGCMPCTDRVRPGEHHRDGRWRDTEKTECGIHLSNAAPSTDSIPDG